MTSDHDTDVAVVGAGPYGLSLAAYLRNRRVACHVFGKTMDSWRRHMPRGMFLKSEGFASSFGDPHGPFRLARFCAEFGREYGDYGVPVDLETFIDYGRWFQKSLVPDVDDVEVRRVARSNSGFSLELADGRAMHARRVVVACGFPRFRHVPAELRHLPSELVSHTADLDDVSALAGDDVVVLGAGQSALESAALLAEGGAVPTLVSRTPQLKWAPEPEPERGRRALSKRVRWPISGLGAGWPTWACANVPLGFRLLPWKRRVRLVKEILGPSGAWWLRDRLEGAIPVLTGHSLVESSVVDGRARLVLSANGGAPVEIVTKHVLAATGYRVDVDRLELLDPVIRADVRRVAGAPELSSTFESSVPGLYFAGLAAAHSFGPLLRFVCGSDFTTRRIGAALAVGAR
jgi:FAD-dependent urate hydroxylase